MTELQIFSATHRFPPFQGSVCNGFYRTYNSPHFTFRFLNQYATEPQVRGRKLALIFWHKVCWQYCQQYNVFTNNILCMNTDKTRIRRIHTRVVSLKLCRGPPFAYRRWRGSAHQIQRSIMVPPDVSGDTSDSSVQEKEHHWVQKEMSELT